MTEINPDYNVHVLSLLKEDFEKTKTSLNFLATNYIENIMRIPGQV
jgi:hypothetical protein